MQPFNNLLHWQRLKSNIKRRPKLVRILQDILKDSANKYGDGEYVVQDLTQVTEYLNEGRTREILRVGKGQKITTTIHGKKIVLVVKTQCFGSESREFFTYTNEAELDDESNEYDWNLGRLAKEARLFEEYAAVGKSVPWVTGVIAGYGRLATLTQDLSHGGKYKIKDKYFGMYEITREGPDGEQDFFTDFKYGCTPVDHHSETDYLKERLQIDRLRI